MQNPGSDAGVFVCTGAGKVAKRPSRKRLAGSFVDPANRTFFLLPMPAKTASPQQKRQ
jgi:hypothetical protein